MGWTNEPVKCLQELLYLYVFQEPQTWWRLSKPRIIRENHGSVEECKPLKMNTSVT